LLNFSTALVGVGLAALTLNYTLAPSGEKPVPTVRVILEPTSLPNDAPLRSHDMNEHGNRIATRTRSRMPRSDFRMRSPTCRVPGRGTEIYAEEFRDVFREPESARLRSRGGGGITEARRMIAHTEYLTIRTATRYEIRDITGEVERVRAAARLDDGFVLVSTMHITSSIFVNDHESGLWSDILTWVEKLAPSGLDYKHHLTGEDNGDAHLKRMLLGHQVLVPVTKGALDLGPWERIHYGEFGRPTPQTRPAQGVWSRRLVIAARPGYRLMTEIGLSTTAPFARAQGVFATSLMASSRSAASMMPNPASGTRAWAKVSSVVAGLPSHAVTVVAVSSTAATTMSRAGARVRLARAVRLVRLSRVRSSPLRRRRPNRETSLLHVLPKRSRCASVPLMRLWAPGSS